MAAFTPGKDLVPIVQEAGWAPEPVWIGAENLAPPGFDPRTFQPVASRYTDYAILAPEIRSGSRKTSVNHYEFQSNTAPYSLMMDRIRSETCWSDY